MRQPVAIPVAPGPHYRIVHTAGTLTAAAPMPPEGARGPENSGFIELEINSVAVRVGRGPDAVTVAAVIHALKTCT